MSEPRDGSTKRQLAASPDYPNKKKRPTLSNPTAPVPSIPHLPPLQCNSKEIKQRGSPHDIIRNLTDGELNKELVSAPIEKCMTIE